MSTEKQPEEKMSLDDEIAHLKKRRNELKTISCNIQDIFDWFKNNDSKTESHVLYSSLDFAIYEVDVVVGDLMEEIESLEMRLGLRGDS